MQVCVSKSSPSTACELFPKRFGNVASPCQWCPCAFMERESSLDAVLDKYFSHN